MSWTIWLCITLVFAIAEVFTLSGFFIFITAGSFGITLLSTVITDITTQGIIFSLFCLMSVLYMWKVNKNKSLPQKVTNPNNLIESVKNKNAIVESNGAELRITFQDSTWSGVSNDTLVAGDKVVIEGMDENKLIVRKLV